VRDVDGGEFGAGQMLVVCLSLLIRVIGVQHKRPEQVEAIVLASPGRMKE
jgi:hypothetical protein